MLKRNKSGTSNHTPAMLLDESTPFAVAEAYKSLRANVIFAAAGSGEKKQKNVMIVSSSIPSEGKSITSANLAISFAQNGGRVLLVDADMRKPVQHKLFDMENETGLSTILVDFATYGEKTVKYGVRPGLDLVSSGRIPPNPSELLGSANMQSFLNRACEEYDYVIIDTPPINIVSDALTFGGETSGILLAVRPELCRRGDIQSTLDRIRMSGIHLLGTVLSNSGAGYSSRPYYKKKYGYGKYRYASYYSHYDRQNKSNDKEGSE